MSLIVSDKGGNYTPCPEGPHIAVCVYVIDLGTQPDTKFKPNKKIRLWFELDEHHIFDEDKGPEPFNLSKKYTQTLGDKSNLRKDLESWRGRAFTTEELKGFDLRNILGKCCLVNVIHAPRNDGKGKYATIASIMPLMKGQKGIQPTKEPAYYDIAQGKDGSYSQLPERVQEEINQSQEFKTKDPNPNHPHEETPDNEPEEDDVPF